MKKILVTVLALITGIALVGPSISYGDPYRYGRGGPGPGAFIGGFGPYGPVPPPPTFYYRERHRNYNDGLAIAGIALGGAILTGILINTLSQPANTRSRDDAYYPPSGSRAYASPDRSFQAPNEGPSGEWVTVRGQWVNGKWVPEHKVWIPVNP
jgi:hypothetical protein